MSASQDSGTRLGSASSIPATTIRLDCGGMSRRRSIACDRGSGECAAAARNPGQCGREDLCGRRLHERHRARSGSGCSWCSSRSFHAVTDEGCIASIDRALSHLPTRRRMIFVTRVDPALSLARYRVAGVLAELQPRARELAFTRAETHELLVTRGEIELGAAVIELLVERTEGWPATLVLAGLWLRTVDDPAAAVRAFGGDHHFVAEVPRAARSSRHSTRTSGRFSQRFASPARVHCRALRRCARPHRLRRRAGRARALPTSSSRGFDGGLASASTRCSPRMPGPRFRTFHPSRAPRPRSSCRAAEWLRSHGLPMEALRHAAAGGDHEFVAEVLVDYHLSLIRGGDGGDVSSLGSHAAGRICSSRTRSWRRPPAVGRGARRRGRDRAAPVHPLADRARVGDTLSRTSTSRSG